MELVLGCARGEELRRLETMAQDKGHFVLACCADGRQLLAKAASLQPDALLCDLPLPYLDGLALCKGVRALGLPGRPMVVLRAPYGLGRGFVLPEGALLGESWEEAFALLPLAGQRELGEASRRAVQRKLQELGVPGHMRGKAYLEEALLLCLKDGQRLKNLRDLVYAPIARDRGVSPASVERDMRYAIEAAWRYGRLQALHENFGYTVLPERGKPTNRAFLAQLTEDLKRQLRQEALEGLQNSDL